MMAHHDMFVWRKLAPILRVLDEANRPLGASRIARVLAQQGILLSERMVRVHLHQLDGLGWTENRGRPGRTITARGRAELQNSPAVEKVGFVVARADTLAHQMTFDLAKRTGSLVLNVSFVPVERLREALDEIEAVYAAGLATGEWVAFARGGETFAGQTVPERYVLIGTVCSLAINGVFLKAGIPMTSVFGGLLEFDNGHPTRFLQIIRYDGTTLDPLEIFIRGVMTSVGSVVRSGRGVIGVGFREIPSSARNEALDLRDALEQAGLGAVQLIGDASHPVLDVPVAHGRTGIVLRAGLNAIAAVEERGIPTRNMAMCTLADWSSLIHYRELRRHLR